MSWYGPLGIAAARGRLAGIVAKVVLMYGCVCTAVAVALLQVGSSTSGAIAGVSIVVLATLVVKWVLDYAKQDPAAAILDATDWMKHQELMQRKGAPPQIAGPPEEYLLDANPVQQQVAAPQAAVDAGSANE